VVNFFAFANRLTRLRNIRLYRVVCSAVTGVALIASIASPARAQESDAGHVEARLRDTETHPERYPPDDWAVLSSFQVSQGDMLRAAFWFYMYQIRSRPWARADTGGGGAAALRASFNATLGADINEWIGADPELWRSVVERAIAYEAKLPLYAGRPPGTDEATWLKTVERERRAYADEAKAAFTKMDPAEVARTRKENSHFVGALSDKGRPLDDSWR